MRALLTSLLLASVFAFIFLAMTWPLALHWRDAYLGSTGSDAYQYVWNAWHFRHRVLAGHNPMAASDLLYPQGVSLWLHTYTPIIGLLHLLVPIGPVAATNLALILSFGFSGAGAAWLARRLRLAWPLALAVGVWFSFSAFRTAHLPEHYHLLLTGAVPFFVGLLPEALAFEPGRWWPRIGKRRALLGCLALGLLTALGDYYTTFWLLYLSAIVWLWFGLRLGERRWRDWRVWLGIGGFVAVAHALVRVLQHFRVEDRGGIWWGGNLSGYLIAPPHLRFLATDYAQQHYANPANFSMPGSIENVVFLGYAVPVLAVGLLLTRRGRAHTVPPALASTALERMLPALTLATVVFLLMTIPTGRLWGHNTLRPPTALLHFVPFLNNLRCPTRAVLLPTLLVPLLTLRAVVRRPWGQVPGFGLLLLGISLLETWPRPIPQTDTRPARRANEALAVRMAPGTLVALPLGVRDGMHEVGHLLTDDLLFQTFHQRPLLSAYVSRLPAETFTDFATDSVVARLLRLQADSGAGGVAPSVAEIRAFRGRYQPAGFLLRPGYQSAGLRRLVGQLQAGLPTAQVRLPDGSLLIYRPRRTSSSH